MLTGKTLIRLIAVLGAACTTPCWAQLDAFKEGISLHLGNHFAASTNATHNNTQTSLEADAAPYYSLGYVLQEAQWRVELELNRSQADIQTKNTTGREGELSSNRLMYNVFWLPAYNPQLSGLIGAGIGYGMHQLSGVSMDTRTIEIKDNGWVAKWVIGVEYKVCHSTRLQVSYENWYGGALKQKNQSNLKVDLPQQSALQLGAVYSF